MSGLRRKLCILGFNSSRELAGRPRSRRYHPDGNQLSGQIRKTSVLDKICQTRVAVKLGVSTMILFIISVRAQKNDARSCCGPKGHRIRCQTRCRPSKASLPTRTRTTEKRAQDPVSRFRSRFPNSHFLIRSK